MPINILLYTKEMKRRRSVKEMKRRRHILATVQYEWKSIKSSINSTEVEYKYFIEEARRERRKKERKKESKERKKERKKKKKEEKEKEEKEERKNYY